MIICPWKDILRYAPILPGLTEAVEEINALTSLEPATYPLSNGGRFLVNHGTTGPADAGKLEAHREFIDVQYIVEGEEQMGWADLATLTPDGAFDPAQDCGFYTGQYDLIPFRAGYCYIVFPEDAHMPTRHTAHPTSYTKIIVKLKA